MTKLEKLQKEYDSMDVTSENFTRMVELIKLIATQEEKEVKNDRAKDAD